MRSCKQVVPKKEESIMAVETRSVRVDRSVCLSTIEKRLTDLPPLPAVVVKIMQTINNPSTSAEDLNNLIRMDQGLASKVLRIVNSAYYGLPKKVSTITQAVMILGFNTVRNLVMGVSAMNAFAVKTIPYGLNREKFWEHSVAVAVTAQALAKKRLSQIRSAAEEAFIGGLLHDIGTLFLDCYFPVQYAVVMAYADKESKTCNVAEQLILGVDHALVGQQIADKWRFPPHLSAMIGEHHLQRVQTEYRDWAWIVHAADCIAWEMGYAATPHALEPEMNSDVREWLGFNEEAWAWVYETSANQFKASASLIQIMKGH